MKFNLLFGALVGALATAGIAAGQVNLLSNGGFENGFPAVPDTLSGVYGTPAVIIDNILDIPGGVIDVVPGATPSQWISSNGGGAGGTNNFLYINAGDTCIEFQNSLQLGPMIAGQRYQVCFFAASASPTGRAYIYGGVTNLSNGFQRIPDGEGNLYYTGDKTSDSGRYLALPTNPAWVDGSPTSIPWQEYCFEFTAPTVVNGVNFAPGTALPDTVSFDLSLDRANNLDSAAVVLDGFRLIPVVVVPEPGSLALLGLAAAGLWTRRRFLAA